MHRQTLWVSMLLGSCLLGCGDPARQAGTPEHFEWLTGFSFEIEAPVAICHNEGKGDRADGASVALYALPDSVVERLREPGPDFEQLPRRLDDEQQRVLVTWRPGPPKETDRKVLFFAMGGARAALRGGCMPEDPGNLASRIEDSLNRSTTRFAYLYELDERERPSYVDLFVLDVDEGVLYEVRH